MSVKIITDSTASLDREFAGKYGIEIIPLSLRFLDEEFTPVFAGEAGDFFKKLGEKKEIPKTSLPSPDSFRRVFAKIKEEGNEAVCLTITSALSGTYESARTGAADFKDTVTVIDSGALAQPLGFLVESAAEAAAAGLKREEIAQLIEEKKKKTGIYFIPDTLEYLAKGGRIGKLTSAIASILKIKPVLSFKNGKFDTEKKALGLKMASNEMLNLLPSKFEKVTGVKIGENSYYGKIAEKFKEKFQITLPDAELSPIVASHVGPGAVGIAYMTE